MKRLIEALIKEGGSRAHNDDDYDPIIDQGAECTSTNFKLPNISC